MLERLLSNLADVETRLNLEAFHQETNTRWYEERGRVEEAQRHRQRAEWCRSVAAQLKAQDALNQYRRIIEALDWAVGQAERRTTINNNVAFYVGVEWGLRHALALVQGSQTPEDWERNFRRFCWGQTTEGEDGI